MATIKGRAFCGLFSSEIDGEKTRKIELGGVAPTGDEEVYLASNFLINGAINWDLVPDGCREWLREMVYGGARGVEKR